MVRELRKKDRTGVLYTRPPRVARILYEAVSEEPMTLRERYRLTDKNEGQAPQPDFGFETWPDLSLNIQPRDRRICRVLETVPVIRNASAIMGWDSVQIPLNGRPLKLQCPQSCSARRLCCAVEGGQVSP